MQEAMKHGCYMSCWSLVSFLPISFSVELAIPRTKSSNLVDCDAAVRARTVVDIRSIKFVLCTRIEVLKRLLYNRVERDVAKICD